MNCPKCGRNILVEKKDDKFVVKTHRVGLRFDPKLGAQSRKKTPCPGSGDEVAVPVEPAN